MVRYVLVHNEQVLSAVVKCVAVNMINNSRSNSQNENQYHLMPTILIILQTSKSILYIVLSIFCWVLLASYMAIKNAVQAKKENTIILAVVITIIALVALEVLIYNAFLHPDQMYRHHLVSFFAGLGLTIIMGIAASLASTQTTNNPATPTPSTIPT
jgi:CDP-diglyceride synthetase